MGFHHTLGNKTYSFDSLKVLLAKASPHRSGDVLAGVAAESNKERLAAQYPQADLSLRHFLNDLLIPYEKDKVTRLTWMILTRKPTPIKKTTKF